LPLTSFIHSGTIAQLAELVNRREDEADHWSPLVTIQTGGKKTPFFGIHAVGGGVLFWRDIVNYLPKDQPFYALQSQGIDGIRPALHRIEEMASLYIQEIRRIQTHGPYYIGGFSLGGEIAFEIAQQLIRQGEQVDLLVLLDTRNPERPIRPVQVEGNNIVPIVRELTPVNRYEILKRKANGHLRKLKQLSLSAKMAYIVRKTGFHIRYAVTSLIAKLFRLFGKRLPDFFLMHYLRDNHRMALKNYVPTLYPGKITIFRASASMKKHPIDSPMGWAPLAGGGVDVHYFDASHEIIKPEYAQLVAQKLNDCIISARNN
jgi:thioesterase domain-containing protein